MVERPHTLPVGNVAIRARREQRIHDLDIGWSAIAEDHRLQQRGPAQAV